MQEPTHLIAGILIQKSFGKVKSRYLKNGLIIATALFSHGILDKLAKMTYHPPNAHFTDMFWLSYHTLIFLLTVFLFYRYWREYKLGMIFAMLPDLDWVIIHGSKIFSLTIPFYKEALLHKNLFSFMNDTFPFYILNLLPNWRMVKITCLLEIIPVTIILGYMITKERKSGPRKGSKTKLSQI